MNISRRKFIQAGGLACGAVGLNLFSPFLQREAWAADPGSRKKMLFVFQRGGNDGVNTLIPRGDPEYNPQNRPTLFIPEGQALDTGNGFAQLHPQLQPLMEIFNQTSLNGQPGPGNLAVLHRIGYLNQSRSHFDSQQFWENGSPGNSDLDEGFIYRRVAKTTNLSSEENAFVAASISGSQLVALKGPNPLPNFSQAGDFSFEGNAAESRKFLGRKGGPRGELGSGLLGLYEAEPKNPSKLYRRLVHQTGEILGATVETLQEATAQGAYAPANGAVYPGGSFGRKLREAAMLFKRTPVRIIGLNLGGWDTHSVQGQINGAHGRLLNDLALGFQALHRDLLGQWDDLIVVTMTEFGRTSMENGSRGTDHAEASVMFVGGGAVRGGVYNCDASTWAAGDLFSKRGRYLSRRTDFRSVFGEIFTRHFGDSPDLLDAIMPGYAAAAAENPSEFKPLGFI